MLKETLMGELKIAMKEKNTISKNTIQSVRAEILRTEKDKQIELTEEQIIEVIMKEKKKREDALEQFQKSNREDLILQTQQEISILEKYLPKQLDDGELETIIIGIIHRGTEGFGPIMKQAKLEIGNQATGKRISDMIKEILNK